MAIDLDYEIKLRKKYGYKSIAGLDEVGRGPLAGPVTAAAFVFLPGSDARSILKSYPILRKLRDSKLLNSKQREQLYQLFHHGEKVGMCEFATASVFPSTIDKKHIQHAVVLAMRRAAKKLEQKPDYALIDAFSYKRQILPGFEYVAVKKADNLVPACAAASIVAKVSRDRTMLRYHKKYPQYRFDLHKGYGTRLHYNMLRKHGPSPIHRKSFRLV